MRIAQSRFSQFLSAVLQQSPESECVKNEFAVSVSQFIALGWGCQNRGRWHDTSFFFTCCCGYFQVHSFAFAMLALAVFVLETS